MRKSDVRKSDVVFGVRAEELIFDYLSGRCSCRDMIDGIEVTHFHIGGEVGVKVWFHEDEEPTWFLFGPSEYRKGIKGL